MECGCKIKHGAPMPHPPSCIVHCPKHAEVDNLLAALKNFLEASADEWLYQTGQFSRRESPPSNYPPQGSVHIGLMGAGEQARAAIKAAERGDTAMTDEEYREKAREQYGKDGEIEIDDDANVSRGHDHTLDMQCDGEPEGAYVQAWVWVAAR